MPNKDLNGLLTEGNPYAVKKSSAEVTIHPELSEISTMRKTFLPSIFRFGQFLDASNNSALFPATPIINEELRFAPSEMVWIISGNQLTSAAFLLMCARIYNLYTPKRPFVVGCLFLDITHLIGAFARQKIALLVLRALGGIGGALTIPSALSLIVQVFFHLSHQAPAISLPGSVGAVGGVIGIIISAVFVQCAGWSWIFWFVAIIGIGIGTV